MARDQRITKLEEKIEQLKHEYDLFLNGNRRTEPLTMRKEAEREVMLLLRFPSSSTAFKFQVQTLAHRFRSLEAQVKNLLELKEQRQASAETIAPDHALQNIIVDDLAISNPDLITARVKTLLKQAGIVGPEQSESAAAALCNMMVSKASAVLGRGNVLAVKYSLVPGEHGPKVKGEVIPRPDPEPV